MSDSFEDFISELKQRVQKMLLERSKASAPDSTATPSPIWTEVLSVFNYLMNLSAEDFRNIIFHSGILSGTSWSYWHRYPQPVPEEEAERIGYLDAIKDVPEEYWIGLPPAPGIPRPLGVDYKGRIINPDMVRFQLCVTSLYRAGALTHIKESKQKQIVIEIGGGFGALTHNFGNFLNEKATCVMVDFPEMFLFQGSFLAVNNPEKEIYIYDGDGFDPETFAREIYDYDFVLIPNYALDKLEEIREIAFLVNLMSFQEMSGEQVEGYLDYAKKRISCCVFSDNVDRHPYNTTGLTSVTTLMEERFKLFPPPQYYEELHRGVSSPYRRMKRYIGLPKTPDDKYPDIRMPGMQTLPTARKASRVRASLKRIIPRPVRRFIRFFLTKLRNLINRMLGV